MKYCSRNSPCRPNTQVKVTQVSIYGPPVQAECLLKASLFGKDIITFPDEISAQSVTQFNSHSMADLSGLPFPSYRAKYEKNV